MKKFILPLFSLVFYGQVCSQAIYELNPSHESSKSFATQWGNFVSCTTVARQVYTALMESPFKVGFYISTDSIITQADLQIGTVTVSCMNTYKPSCNTTYDGLVFTRTCSVSN